MRGFAECRTVYTYGFCIFSFSPFSPFELFIFWTEVNNLLKCAFMHGSGWKKWEEFLASGSMQNSGTSQPWFRIVPTTTDHLTQSRFSKHIRNWLKGDINNHTHESRNWHFISSKSGGRGKGKRYMCTTRALKPILHWD